MIALKKPSLQALIFWPVNSYFFSVKTFSVFRTLGSCIDKCLWGDRLDNLCLEHVSTHLIKHSVISGQRGILSGHESEHSTPVLEGDQNNVVVVEDVVRLVFSCWSADKVASVNPYDDRPVLANDKVPGEHVQPEAVFVACKCIVISCLNGKCNNFTFL